MKALAGASATAAVAVLALGVWLLIRSNEPKPIETTAAAVVAPAPPPVETVVPVAPPPAAAPAAADMADLLKENAIETNTEGAFAQLFSLWGGKFDPAHGRPCDQALSQGLECVYQQGSWGQLRTLNRPAILTLIDDAGNAHQVVIAALNDGNASIDLKGAQHEVSIASVSRFWYGDYLVLWRPQVASPRALSAGMQGDGVRWLRQSLNTAQGRASAGKPSDVYDQELVRMVEDFQRQHRLNVDGIAGVQTQIVLDTLNNSAGAPLLMAQTSGG
jgi:general secretion pathway protein A